MACGVQGLGTVVWGFGIFEEGGRVWGLCLGGGRGGGEGGGGVRGLPGFGFGGQGLGLKVQGAGLFVLNELPLYPCIEYEIPTVVLYRDTLPIRPP